MNIYIYISYERNKIRMMEIEERTLVQPTIKSSV